MLMALLYGEDDQIAAAAPACDQIPLGDRYWSDIHAGELKSGNVYQTAYVTVANASLREKLLLIGIDELFDAGKLTAELSRSIQPEYDVSDRAA